MVNRFKITTGIDPRDNRIWLNGTELPDVVRVSFDLNAANHPHMLRLEIMAEVEVEGEFVEQSFVTHGLGHIPRLHRRLFLR